MTYAPPKKILENFAKILVHFGLREGKGIEKGDVVLVYFDELGRDLFAEVAREIYRSGGNVISQWAGTGMARMLFDEGTDEQTTFFPAKLRKALVEEMDSLIFIRADGDPHELNGVDPKRIMARQAAFKPWMDWRREKEDAGNLSWTLMTLPTEPTAQEAGMTLKEYWDEVIHICMLDDEDPVARWKEMQQEHKRITSALNDLNIEKVHVKADTIDLTIGIGKDRAWVGVTGHNIPSFEIYTSPDNRIADGFIEFNIPLYRYSTKITGIRLDFKDGVIIKASAEENEAVLKEMIAQTGANRIGEFSLTDKRHSRITKFMADTLYDENMGGPFGNTHIAVGNAYRSCFKGVVKNTIDKQFKEMGFNESIIHTDMFSTTDRTVTATLPDGSTIVIYKDGMWHV